MTNLIIYMFFIFVMQSSLAAAKKTLGADLPAVRPGKPEGSPSPHYYDCEEARTPGEGTPTKHANNGLDVGTGREINGGLNSVGPLVKEFEQRKQNFDDEAKAIVEVKSEQHPDMELRKLKQRFEEWKKDYKLRLREAKAKLHKLGHSEGEKNRLKWWGKRAKRLHL